MTNSTVRFLSVAIAGTLAGCSTLNGMFGGSPTSTESTVSSSPPVSSRRTLPDNAQQANRDTTPPPRREATPRTETFVGVPSAPTPSPTMSTPPPKPSQTPYPTFAPTPTPYPCPTSDGSQPLLWGEIIPASGSVGHELKLTGTCWNEGYNPSPTAAYPVAVGAVDDQLYLLVIAMEYVEEPSAIFRISGRVENLVEFELWRLFKKPSPNETPAPAQSPPSRFPTNMNWSNNYPNYSTFSRLLPGNPRTHTQDGVGIEERTGAIRLSQIAEARFDAATVLFPCSAAAESDGAEFMPVINYWYDTAEERGMPFFGGIAAGERYALLSGVGTRVYEPWGSYLEGGKISVAATDKEGRCSDVTSIFTPDGDWGTIWGGSPYQSFYIGSLYGLELPAYASNIGFARFARVVHSGKGRDIVYVVTEDEIAEVLSSENRVLRSSPRTTLTPYSR